MSEKQEDPKGYLDKGLGKFVSRKLLVFIISTIFFCLTMIPVDTWAMITVGYVGIQGFSDIVKMWRTTA